MNKCNLQHRKELSCKEETKSYQLGDGYFYQNSIYIDAIGFKNH